jgi:CBS domain-containing protein
MELARNLKVESVSRLQPPAPICLQPQQTVTEAIDRMRLHRMGCVLVCAGETLVGIFTERDLIRRILAPRLSLETPLHECMTVQPVSVQPSESVGTALRLMQEGGYRHLPIVTGFGKPVGILSAKRFARYVVEHFPDTIYCLPPDPDQYPRQREGA